jgi:hypothetical protein
MIYSEIRHSSGENAASRIVLHELGRISGTRENLVKDTSQPGENRSVRRNTW